MIFFQFYFSSKAKNLVKKVLSVEKNRRNKDFFFF